MPMSQTRTWALVDGVPKEGSQGNLLLTLAACGHKKQHVGCMLDMLLGWMQLPEYRLLSLDALQVRRMHRLGQPHAWHAAPSWCGAKGCGSCESM